MINFAFSSCPSARIAPTELRAFTVLALVCLLASPATRAAVGLPAILSDHMVLQRRAHVPVWGTATPGERVSVAFGQRTASTRADVGGRWRVELNLEDADAGPRTMTVSGADNSVSIDDVLVGEVWLASGQSNMEMPLVARPGKSSNKDAAASVAAADHPQIRLFKVARGKAEQPAADLSGHWVVCTPEAIAANQFSAVAYYFGQAVEARLRSPVGLIDTTFGGTRIEPWTPRNAPPTMLGDAALDARLADPHTGELYNAMVAPLVPFALRGVLWYQGESNVIGDDDIGLYTARMDKLVRGWRSAWQRNLPFYYVQIAPHLYSVVRSKEVASPYRLPEMWEAQARAQAIPDTAMVVINDLVDDPRDIHPGAKGPVGQRLADLALYKTYGRGNAAAEGPVFRSALLSGSRVMVAFDHATGLRARDGKPLDWFELAGADGRFAPATARIADGTVVVESATVPVPAYVRFGWHESARPNLENGAALPVGAFRAAVRPAGERQD